MKKYSSDRMISKKIRLKESALWLGKVRNAHKWGRGLGFEKLVNQKA
jgi:hypothetical protein